jgi:hypothetical protein
MASSGSSELRFEVGLDALTCVGERHQSEAAIRRIGLALDHAASLERVGERRDVGGVVLQAPGELPLRERLHPRAQRYLVQRLEAAHQSLI